MSRLLALLGVTLLAPFALAEDFKLSVDEQAVLDGVNAERKKAELPPLTPSPRLFEAARGHSRNMAKQEKLDHTLDEKTFMDRILATEYKAAVAGENVAWNAPDGKAVVAMWMDSMPHRENILNKDFTEVGIGVAASANGERYWTLLFAAPR